MKNILFVIAIVISVKAFGQQLNSKFNYVVDSVYSTKANCFKKMVIYTPGGYTKFEKCPLIIATDGQQINMKHYVNKIDSLIQKNILPRMVIVGVYANNKSLPKDYLKNCVGDFAFRNYEYCKKECDRSTHKELQNLYYNHEFFIKNELIEYLNHKGIYVGNKIFYGRSNGAAFGISFSLRNPSFFSKVICISTANSEYEDILKVKTKYPKFYISYGNNEFFLLKEESQKLVKDLEKNNISVVSNMYQGDHKKDKWAKEFIRILTTLY